MGQPPHRPVVVQVTNSLARAGAERIAIDLARRLDPREWDVHVVVVRDGPLREYVEGEGIHLYQTGHGFDRTAVLALIKMVIYFRTMRPEIVHTHLLGSDIVGRVAALLAGVPVIVSTQHDMLPRPWHWRLYKRMTARAATTVACSSQVADYCRSTLKIPSGRLQKIDNGVDVDMFASAAHPRTGPVRFGAVGSLTPVKGHRILIEAFAQVVAEIPDARLIIAGEGVEREALTRRSRELGLGDSVELRGIVHNVPELLGEIDVFVHPSLSEGLPLALLEAMAAARPCIATQVAVLPEVLGCPESGACVPPSEPGALADAMIHLAREPEVAANMGLRAQGRVRERYSIERTTGAYAELYRNLLAGVTYVPRTAAPREPRWWRLGALLLKSTLLGLLLFFVSRALISAFSQVSLATLSIDIPGLAASSVLLGLYYLLFAGGLTLLFRATGYRASFGDVFKISFTANLTKYLPGGVWPIATRAALAHKLGINRSTAIMLSVAESVVSVAGGALAIAVSAMLTGTAPGLPGASLWIGLGVALAVGAALPYVLSGKLLMLLPRGLGMRASVHRIDHRRSLGLILYYAGTWSVAGLAFRTLAASVAGDPGAGWMPYTAFYAFASIVGLLVLFAPGGIGAREGALLLVLSGPLGAPTAAVVTVLARLWSTVTELVVSIVAVLIPYRSVHSTGSRHEETESS